MGGGQGDDLVAGEAGSDRILGGEGSDTVYSTGDYVGDLVDCGVGTDTITADRYDRLVGCEKVTRL